MPLPTFNSHWFDENDEYVPLAERDIRENDIFSKILKDMEGVADYSQIGGYLHIHTDNDPSKVANELAERHGGIKTFVRERIEKGFSIANSNHMVVIEFKAK